MLQSLEIKQHYQSIETFLDVNDPVWKAWRTMKENQIKQLPVVQNDRIVGIVSGRDIVQISGYNGGQNLPVKDAMSLDPLIVSLEDSMEQVLRLMLNKDQQQAVVIDQDGKICGMFSWSCAFKFFLEFADINNLQLLLSS